MTSSKQILSFKAFSFLLRRALLATLTLLVVNEAGAQFAPQNDAIHPIHRRSAHTPEYPRPLRFDVIGDGVTMKPLVFDYDLQTSNGRSLKMGNIKFDETTFFAVLLPANRLDSRLFKVLPKAAEREWVFAMVWPENSIIDGTLEMISRTGRVLWTYNINKRDRDYWEEQKNIWKEILFQARYKPEEIERLPLFSTQFGLRDVRNQGTPFWDVEENFRFCLTSVKGAGQTRLCTPQYQIRKNREALRLEQVSLSAAPARVIMNNEAAPLRKSEEVTIAKPIQFFAELASGASLEFYAIPENLKLVEMTELKNSSRVFVVGEGELPLQKARIVKDKEFGAFVELIGWQQTIGDFRRFWQAEIRREDSFVMIPGDGGGFFRQDFEITKLPREEVRPYMHRRTIDATYVNGAKVFVRKNKELKITSEMNSVEPDDEDKSQLLWRFQAEERGQQNRSYLLINDGENTYKAYYELYKGYPRELSARLTGILGSQSNYILMGEVAFNYWFEDIFGWPQYYLSRQRWGFSSKAFRSLTPIKISSRSSELESLTAEMKYRLSPGLWNRDETWGLMAGYQSVSYDEFKSDMLGAGIFWARSMPKVFDDFLNLAPFMRYPKWVDMEFIYYMQGLKADSRLRNPYDTSGAAGNWSLNFHGKVLWGKNVFGEAGFGIKQYDFNKEFATGTVRKLNFTFTSFYGTAGMGISF